MPQEFLRDVLRTGDKAERTRRRLSILPLSIAAHAAAAMLFVIIPLAAEVELPRIPSLLNSYMETVDPPAPPPAARPAVTSPQPLSHVPLEAPPEIVPASDAPRRTVSDLSIDSIDVGPARSGVEGGFGTEAPVPVAILPPPPPQPKIVRAGAHGIREPKRVQYIVPEYPEIARLSRVEGTVILEAVLDATGRVQSVRVLKSVTLLDEAAVRAVRQWRYTPTELNGVPVPVLMTITVNFSLAR